MNSFHELSSRLSAEVGIAIASVGSSPVSLGTWSSGVAWSTSKVPLVIAALRAGVGTRELVALTIAQSDNAAAEELWSRLGDPADAARQVSGRHPRGRRRSHRGRITTTPRGLYGLRADAMVAGRPSPVRGRTCAGCRGVACRRSDARALTTDHRWGLAAKGFAAKGGWGPGLGDDYLVRQFGIVPTASGTVGVAIAAEVHDGEYEAGVDVVNRLADWVVDEALTQQ